MRPDKLIVAPAEFMQLIQDTYKELNPNEKDWYIADEIGNVVERFFAKTTQGDCVADFPKIHNIYLSGTPAEQAAVDASLGDWNQYVKNTNSVDIVRPIIP